MISGKLTCVILVLVVLTIDYIGGQREKSTRRQSNNLMRNASQATPQRRLTANQIKQNPSRKTGNTRGRSANANNARRPSSNGRGGRRRRQRHGSSINLSDFECGVHYEPPKEEAGGRYKRFVAGGFNAGLYSYPSYIKLTVTTADGMTKKCGGTLISRQHIISATHCFKPMPYQSVRAESTIYDEPPPGTLRLPVEKVCHLPVKKSDVSILKLVRPVEFSATLQPACLPTERITESFHGIAVGLGAVFVEDVETNPSYDLPHELQALPVRKVPCSWDDKHWTHLCFQPYLDEYLGDTCMGDSGGGVFMAPNGKQTLYGVTSHGPEWTCREGQIGYSINADVFNLRENIIDLLNKC